MVRLFPDSSSYRYVSSRSLRESSGDYLRVTSCNKTSPPVAKVFCCRPRVTIWIAPLVFIAWIPPSML